MNRELLKSQLRVHEGERSIVYDDATGEPITRGSVVSGHATIGCGRNLAGKGLSEDEIQYLLDNDISDAHKDASTFHWFSALDDVRQNVIVELIFNMGLPRFKTFKKMISAVSQHDWDNAAAELLDSKWQRQVHIGRAYLIAYQLRTGEVDLP